MLWRTTASTYLLLLLFLPPDAVCRIGVTPPNTHTQERNLPRLVSHGHALVTMESAVPFLLAYDCGGGMLRLLLCFAWYFTQRRQHGPWQDSRLLQAWHAANRNSILLV